MRIGICIFALLSMLCSKVDAQMTIGATSQMGRYYHYNPNEWNYKSSDSKPANIRPDHSDGINNYQTGLFISCQLFPQLVLQTELLYGRQKQLFEAEVAHYKSKNFYTANSYLRLPLLLKWSLPTSRDRKHGFYAEFGLSLGILLHYKEVADFRHTYFAPLDESRYAYILTPNHIVRIDSNKNYYNWNPYYTRIYSDITLSVNLGLGWQSTFKNGFVFWLGARAECGLTNLENIRPKCKPWHSCYYYFSNGIRANIPGEGYGSRKITRGIFFNAALGLGYMFNHLPTLPCKKIKKQQKF